MTLRGKLRQDDEAKASGYVVLMKRFVTVLISVGLLAGLIGCSYSSDEIAELEAELNDVVAELDTLKEKNDALIDDYFNELLTDFAENYEGDPIDGGTVDTEDLDGPFLTFIHEGECASNNYVTCIRLSNPMTAVMLTAYPNEGNYSINRADCYTDDIPYHLRRHTRGGGLFQAFAHTLDGGREEGRASIIFTDPLNDGPRNEWHVAYCPYLRVTVWTDMSFEQYRPDR